MDLRIKDKSIPAACGNNNKQPQQMGGQDRHCKVVAKEHSEHYALMNIDKMERTLKRNDDYLLYECEKKVKRKRHWN